MDSTCFISDLHLSPERPATLEVLGRFLEGRAARARRLYILGDLFDVWIGDDDDSPFNLEVGARLRSLRDRGTELYFMGGNRDFLVGRRFARATGCALLPDVQVIDLHGTPTLITHGDLLCTDDRAYQRFRRRVRNPLVIWLFLRKSLARRRAIAAYYRARGRRAVADKAPEIMDANPRAVEAYLRQWRVRQLIHGHTHRPACHHLTLDGQPATRWVLADWQERRGEALVCTPDGIRAEPLD